MNAVWFILTVGLLNTFLGFGIAVRLGARHRARGADPSDWDFGDTFTWSDDPEKSEPPAAVMDSESVEAAAMNGFEENLQREATEAAGPASGAEIPENDCSGADDGHSAESVSPLGLRPAPGEANRMSGGVEESAEPANRGTATSPSAPGTEPSNPAIPQTSPKAVGEKAVEEFLAEVEQYQEELGRVDAELREQTEAPDGDSIRACLESLLEANRDFVEQRERAKAELEYVRGEQPEFGMVCVHLQDVVGKQDERIESTHRAIAAFPYTDDLANGCRVMVNETSKLMDANLLLRDSLQEAGVGLARREARPAKPILGDGRDPLTDAETRASIESTLVQWLQEGARRVDTLSAAALDIDAFSDVNRQYGHALGDQLLHALGQLLITETGSRARLARFSGERFLLLFPDAGLLAATNAVERLRQVIEAACFDYKQEEIRITVSCGVTEASIGDTPESMLARTEAALLEAKRYGRNRTFMHEGKYPTPVVPPKLSAGPRRMTL